MKQAVSSIHCNSIFICILTEYTVIYMYSPFNSQEGRNLVTFMYIQKTSVDCQIMKFGNVHTIPFDLLV